MAERAVCWEQSMCTCAQHLAAQHTVGFQLGALIQFNLLAEVRCTVAAASWRKLWQVSPGRVDFKQQTVNIPVNAAVNFLHLLHCPAGEEEAADPFA